MVSIEKNPPLSRLQRKTTVETLWLYILASLASEGPTYGYNVRKIITSKFGFKPSTVTLYTVLYRLERQGYLKKENDTYTITEKGIELLTKGIEHLEKTVNMLKKSLVSLEGGSNGP